MESGGEGVILRRARSLYVHGRSDYLLKLKAARADREALVVSVNHNDLSFELQLPDGIIFSTPAQNRNVFEELPIRGDVVTFTCENYSRKFTPVNAEILRIRKDVTWRDVIRDYVAERSRSLDLNESSQKGSGFTEKESGFMREQKMQKLKEKLISTAIKLNLDPNLPSTWYSLFASIMKIKEIAHMINKFKGGYPKLIMHLFPDIGLKESEFPSLRKYWTNINNQRQLFLEFAQHNHFDPLVPENWYSVKSDSLKSFEGARSVLQFYGNGHVNALLHLFPEIGLKQHLFNIKPRGYWQDFENQRKFFILFAQQKGFDPMVALNWKNVSADEIRSRQGASSLLGHFSGSVQKALLHVFPNIGLSKKLFSNSDHREFLVNFAKEKELDPFIADSWYSVRASHFASTKNGRSFLSSVQGNFKQALHNAFPNIFFDDSLFHDPLVKTVKDQKKFLEIFAKQKGFDHLFPENWYAVSANQIRSRKGGDQLLAQYDGNYIKAIMTIFPDIGLVKDRFPKSYKFWANEDNQRELFLSFAKGRKFNPKVPDHWYNHIGDFVKVQKEKNFLASGSTTIFPNLVFLQQQEKVEAIKITSVGGEIAQDFKTYLHICVPTPRETIMPKYAIGQAERLRQLLSCIKIVFYYLNLIL